MKSLQFGFKWPHNSIYPLAVNFSCDPVLANKLNLEEKVYNLEQTLHRWKRRNLNLIGRINIVKTLGLAKLVYSTFDNLEAAYRHLIKLTSGLFGTAKPQKLREKRLSRKRNAVAWK